MSVSEWPVPECVRNSVLLGMLLCFSTIGCKPPPPAVVQTPPPPVTVSLPIVKEVVNHDEFEGRLAAMKRVEVRARVTGHLIKIHFEDGQLVKEGDLLFEIDDRVYKASLDAAEADLASAKASLKLAKVELERYTGLLAKGATTREDFDLREAKEATSQADLLKAEASVERAQLDMDFTRVTAPLGGKLSRTQVDVGNLVNAGGSETLLTTIVSIDPIYAYFTVDERSLLQYRRNRAKQRKEGEDPPSVKELKIPIIVALEGETVFDHTGFIDFADNKVNASTGTILVRGVLDNSGHLFEDGMRARVRVPTGDPYQAILVSELAIGAEQGLKYVYVVDDQDVVQRRDVTLDRLIDGLQVVKSGIEPGQWVIVNGIQRARDGVKVEPHRVPMPGASPEPQASTPAGTPR